MSYPSDLNDQAWELIKHNFNYGHYGKGRRHTIRAMVNAVFYVIKTGCQWRMLPKDLPPWKSVYSFFSRAKAKGIWEKMMKELVKCDRVLSGRNPEPSFGIIDSQSVKTTSASKKRGIDGGKKDKGA